jgi:hypothetical protein
MADGTSRKTAATARRAFANVHLDFIKLFKAGPLPPTTVGKTGY